MMDIYLLISVFILLELFESTWQKSATLHHYLETNFYVYNKNLFFYLLLHLSFFYCIFLVFYLNNFSFLMLSIFFMKFADISFKLSIMKKIENKIELNDIIPFNINMGLTFRYANVFIYPLSFILATILQ